VPDTFIDVPSVSRLTISFLRALQPHFVGRPEPIVPADSAEFKSGS
jgi:hypothetical protein